MPSIPDRLEFGQTFGRLVVLDDSESTTHVRCACQCGSVRDIRRTSLRAGESRSCGCIAKEGNAIRERKHGLSGSPEYKVWCAMKSRCSNPNHPSYDRYGGRGIVVCERWMRFENFFADMGPRPSKGYEIDREDNNKGYEPGNCAWVTKRKNSQNTSQSKRWILNGVEYSCMKDAADDLGVSEGTISAWCQGTTVAGRRYGPRPNCSSVPVYERPLMGGS